TAITGTVSPEASAAPRNSAVEYRPIISPARWEKSLLIAVGSSTLPTAMAAPTSTVPAKSASRLGCSRRPMPAARTIIRIPSTRCMPNLRVSAGARNANAPKAKTGIVVSRLPTAALRPVSPRMSPSTGPTEATPMRRFETDEDQSRPQAQQTQPTPTAAGRQSPRRFDDGHALLGEAEVRFGVRVESLHVVLIVLGSLLILPHSSGPRLGGEPVN